MPLKMQALKTLWHKATTLADGAAQASRDRGWLESISAYRHELDDFSKGRGRSIRFPAALEPEFRNFNRLRAWMPRISATLLTGLLILSAPFWVQSLLAVPETTLGPTLVMDLFVLGPLFILTTIVLAWRPAGEVGEWLFMAAFLVEAGAIELMRFYAAASDYYVSPLLSVAIPLAVIGIGRLPFFRSCAFVLAYLSLLAAKHYLLPNTQWPRKETDILTMAIMLGSILVASAFSQRNLRQMWAFMQLSLLGTWYDYLTSLPNRSAFEQHVERWMKAGLREGRKYVVALIDLDHFKYINDRYGHQHGDGVLVEAALCLAEYARRPGDIAARVGGEEFALFLYDCDLDAATRRLEELRARVQALGIENVDSRHGVVTVSIGAVVMSRAAPVALAYKKADEHLYEAKNSGRNKVVLG